MRHILPFILIQLLFNGFSSQSPGNIQSDLDSFEVPKKHPQQRIIRRTEQNGTQFIDLCDDVILEIFSNLHVVDFLKLLEACSEFSFLINSSFRRKYGECEFGMMSTNFIETDIIHEYPDDKRIEIYALRRLKEIISQFGHLITRIGATNQYIRDSQSKDINRFIQEYCANTLTHLKLDFIKENTFQTFTVSLSNLEELSFLVNVECVKKGVLALNELAPNLKRLSVRLYTHTDYSFIECEFPHLEHLFFGVSGPSIVFQQREQIDGILKKNPQIKSIEIHAFPKDCARDTHTFAKY